MHETIPPLPCYSFTAWCSVIKHMGNFTVTFNR